MKKFMKNAVKVLCLVLVMTIVMSPMTLALNFNDFAPDVSNTGAETVGGKVKSLGAEIAGIVQIVGYAVAVVMIIVIGIQYIIATPAKKAELKGKLWSMAIGVVLIVAGVTILNVVANLGTQVDTALGGTTQNG